jgi:hypothetical protein
MKNLISKVKRNDRRLVGNLCAIFFQVESDKRLVGLNLVERNSNESNACGCRQQNAISISKSSDKNKVLGFPLCSDG